MDDDDNDRCPHCGCNDITMLSEAKELAPANDQHPAWIHPARAECNHCNRQFQTTDAPPVPERTRPLRFEIPCPTCHTHNTEVYCTKPPRHGIQTRYLKCVNGHTFKTNDEIEPPSLTIR